MDKVVVFRFQSGQGLGNQLWSYASLRGVAHKIGAEFYVLNRGAFKGHGFLEIEFESKSIKNLNIENHFNEKLFYDDDLSYFASSFDERIVEIEGVTEIQGLFQSEKYFFGKTNEIGKWIKLNQEMVEYSKQFKGKCIINIRGGEYKRFKNLILPSTYWHNAINLVKERGIADDFLIVTDDPRYTEKLLPGIPVLKGGVQECYAAIYGASSVIVSNSSFAYYPIKSREDAPFVIAPAHWSRYGNKFNRWAAPGNFDEKWNWLNNQGDLMKVDECKDIIRSTESLYNSYNICVRPGLVGESRLRKKIPRPIRLWVKKMVSILFPKHIG